LESAQSGERGFNAPKKWFHVVRHSDSFSSLFLCVCAFLKFKPCTFLLEFVLVEENCFVQGLFFCFPCLKAVFKYSALLYDVDSKFATRQNVDLQIVTISKCHIAYQCTLT
jgi:hypothetical protein